MGMRLGSALQTGDVICLQGDLGAGKTTLLELIAGFRKPQQGRIQFEDRLLIDVSRSIFLPAYQRNIGYVPQDDIIHRELTVYRTLYYVARLRLSRDISTQEIDEVLAK